MERKESASECSANPLVSVVIPVYNASGLIGETVSNLQNQTLRDIQIVFVDNGSSDDTYSRLDSAREQDDRIMLLLQKGGGAGAARNRGLAAATGKYLIFLDADDYFFPALLERLATALEESGADIAMCESNQFTDGENQEGVPHFRFAAGIEEGLHTPVEFGQSLYQVSIPVVWNKMYRKSFVDDSGVRFQEQHNSNDVFFTATLLAKASSIYVVREPLVSYRKGLGTSLQDTRIKEPLCQLAAAEAIYDEIGDILTEPQKQSLLYYCFKLLSGTVRMAVAAGVYDEELHQRIQSDLVAWGAADRGGADVFPFSRKLHLWCCLNASKAGIVWAYKNASTMRERIGRDVQVKLVLAGIVGLLRFGHLAGSEQPR